MFIPEGLNRRSINKHFQNTGIRAVVFGDYKYKVTRRLYIGIEHLQKLRCARIVHGWLKKVDRQLCQIQHTDFLAVLLEELSGNLGNTRRGAFFPVGGYNNGYHGKKGTRKEGGRFMGVANGEWRMISGECDKKNGLNQQPVSF